MNYIEQIRGFWRLHEEHSFNTTDVALYFYLLEICNICRWKNPFKRNNAKIEADLGISFNTLKNARNRLQQHGIISFKTTNGSPNVTYTLLNFDEVAHKVNNEDTNKVANELVPAKEKLKQTIPKQTNANEGKENPPTPHEAFVSVKELKERLDKNHWLEQVAIRYTENYWILRAKFFDFCDSLILKGIESKTETDLKSHFVNLLNLQKEKSCAKKEKVIAATSPKKSKVEQNAEVLQQVLQDIENEYRTDRD